MRFTTLFTAIAAVFALSVTAADPKLEAVVVSYPNDTPDWVIEKAKKSIRDAGGFITHEYNLLKGYSAELPTTILSNMVSAAQELLGTAAFPAYIEKDQIVHTYGDDE